jgi:hypothetical protein
MLTRTRTSRILPRKGGFRCRLCFKSRPNSALPPRVKTGSLHLQKGDQLRIHQRRTPHPPARIVASGPQPPSQKRGLHWHRCTCLWASPDVKRVVLPRSREILVQPFLKGLASCSLPAGLWKILSARSSAHQERYKNNHDWVRFTFAFTFPFPF